MVSSHYGNTLQLACLRMKLRLMKARKNARLPAEQTQYNAPIKGCSFISTRDVFPIQYVICLLSSSNDKANYSNLISFSVPQTDSKSSPHEWQRVVCVWAFCVLPQSWLQLSFPHQHLDPLYQNSVLLNQLSPFLVGTRLAMPQMDEGVFYYIRSSQRLVF